MLADAERAQGAVAVEEGEVEREVEEAFHGPKRTKGVGQKVTGAFAAARVASLAGRDYNPGVDTGTIALSRLRRWTRAEYDRLVELGVFEGERIELLRGVIVEMSPQSVEHASPIQEATHYLVRLLGDRARVRVQLPFAASDDSEPEPDIAVVPPGAYADAHPSVAWLIIEVATPSLATDRDKGGVYALASSPSPTGRPNRDRGAAPAATRGGLTHPALDTPPAPPTRYMAPTTPSEVS